MDFLLNPNVAYLLLVSGFLLGFMALLTPGTGLIEISALIVLLIAGYEIYNLPVNLVALIVLVLGVVPFILAIRRPGRWIYLVIAIVAFVVGSVFLFRDETRWWVPEVNPLLAIVVSVLTSGYLWISVHKALEAALLRPRHNLADLIGQTGETKTAVFTDGSVQAGGELWSAQSDQPIPAGSEIRVIGREGFVLKVEKLQETVKEL